MPESLLHRLAAISYETRNAGFGGKWDYLNSIAKGQEIAAIRAVFLAASDAGGEFGAKCREIAKGDG